MRFAITFIFLSSIAMAQDKDIDAIRAVFSSQQKAWNSGNLEAFMQGYWKSDSLKFIGSRGPTYGWQSTLESYKRGYPNKETMGELTLSIISFEKLSKSSIFVIGKYQLKRSTDSPSGYFTLLWKKIKNQWVIVVDHSS